MINERFCVWGQALEYYFLGLVLTSAAVVGAGTVACPYKKWPTIESNPN